MYKEVVQLIRGYIPWWRDEVVEPKDCLPVLCEVDLASEDDGIRFIAELKWYSTVFIRIEEV